MRQHCTILTQVVLTLVLVFATSVQSIAGNLDQIVDQQQIDSVQDQHAEDCTEHGDDENPIECCQLSSVPFLATNIVNLASLVENPLFSRLFDTLYSQPETLFRPPIA